MTAETSRMFVKPLREGPVPKPDGSVLSAQGETLDASGWWRRRGADGDVVISAARPAKRPANTPVKAPSKEV